MAGTVASDALPTAALYGNPAALAPGVPAAGSEVHPASANESAEAVEASLASMFRAFVRALGERVRDGVVPSVVQTGASTPLDTLLRTVIVIAPSPPLRQTRDSSSLTGH